MADDIQFVDGLIVKAPRPGAPDFVKASISIKVADLGVWLREEYKKGNKEWINVDVKTSKGGKWYAVVNTFKPEKKAAPEQKRPMEDMADDIPFASCSLGDDVIFKNLRWPLE